MPSQDPKMTEVRTDAIRGLLAETIRDEPEFRRRRIRRRLLIWGGVGLITIGGLSTAGSVLFGDAPLTDQSIVQCFSSTVPNADGTFPGSGATVATKDGPGRVDDALALCSEMWRHGILSSGYDPTAATYAPEETEVPALQVCVMRDGTAAVVPSEDAAICQALGMSALAR
ncbi:hypothetical protein ABIE21_002471 [Conyzicola nivalis]|uniref:Septum formation-related domain-containing protein n=2 Tax=Conyzicola nivalis TaxID=1477021 RepID=A0ABV2QPI6_9MICO